MRVQLIVKDERQISGMSRYAAGLAQALTGAGMAVDLTAATPGAALRVLARGAGPLGLDLEAFFCNYPLRVELHDCDVYHLAGQTLATVLALQHFSRPVVVSVLDIIPYLVRGDPRLDTLGNSSAAFLYRLAIRGLARASALITISHYSKQTLVEALGISSDRIHVVYPAIDHTRFWRRPAPESFYARYGVSREHALLLYVGSEDPRKNLPALIRALAIIRLRHPEVRLLKVGAPCFAAEHQRIEALIEELGLRSNVMFFDGVTDEDLADFYNAAAVCALPSRYEGFGLPALESMACGTPVVAANAGSLPEVTGGAGLLHDPDDPQALSSAITALLEDRALWERCSARGMERAAEFTWQRCANETARVYASLETDRRKAGRA